VTSVFFAISYVMVCGLKWQIRAIQRVSDMHVFVLPINYIQVEFCDADEHAL
jgi:hypothetical protein